MEKYMTILLGNNLVFIDSMQLLNSSLENLFKNSPKNKFKDLYPEFRKKQFELVKKRYITHMNI